MNRGSDNFASMLAERSKCFNEAPIHESGKYRGGKRGGGRRRSRFNEAPIHESGKSDRPS